MGNEHSFDYQMISELENETHFTKNELHALHKQFLKIASESKEDSYSINRDQFIEAIKGVLTVGEGKEKLLINLFEVWDKDHNERINFHEFIVGLSVISRGSLMERIRRKKKKKILL